MKKRPKRHVGVRKDDGYYEFRKAVLTRDGRKCQFPNCKRRSKLEVHHILVYSQYAQWRTNISNGITLCSKHHKFIKGKEAFYTRMFQEIVAFNDRRQ